MRWILASLASVSLGCQRTAGEAPDGPAPTPPADHAPPFARTHGRLVGQPADCARCHQPDPCATCHATRAPRDHHAGFARRPHGLAARLDPERCATCHQRSFCADCH